MGIATTTQQRSQAPASSQLTAHLFFPILTGILLATFKWPLRWFFSGSPILTYFMILGEARQSRTMAFIPLWTAITLVNLVYALAATSWLFYWLFTFACYPAIILSCLFQFETFAKFVRRKLGKILRQLHFINDKIAFFDLPALEIDTDVEGLFVIRGITFSLTRLSLTAHGTEVGIKLSEDMELAIQVDEVRVLFFRRIEVGDVYANVKGGEYEMTFGKLAKHNKSDTLLVSETPLLQAAALKGDTTRPDLSRMTSKMTDGAEPENASVKAGLDSVTQITPDGGDAERKYERALRYIHKTSAIQQCIQEVEKQVSDDQSKNFNSDLKQMRAVVCSQLHDRPSVPHPPLRSIKVTTLQHLSPPKVRRFLHRLPFLLRLLLNPLSYFHPIKIQSITAGGSGKWLQYMLDQQVFKSYGEENAGLRKLQKRMGAWLADANFVLELVDIAADAQVPVSTSFNILNQIKVIDILAFRTLPKEIDLSQVVRLGGADATIAIPMFLMPHHEHILPPKPDAEDERRQEKEIETADGKPQEFHAQVALEQMKKDETNIKLSVHASLPAVFDQELLDFIMALAKAMKFIDIEKDGDGDGEEEIADSDSATSPTRKSFKSAALSLGTNMRDSIRRAGVDTVMNDRWIAKLVGKITKKLENTRGDVGYSGDIPVLLQPYRDAAESDLKLMP